MAEAQFKIWRGSGTEGHFEEYSTEIDEGMVVLEDFDRGPERFVERLAENAGVGFVNVPDAFRERLAAGNGKQRLFVRGDRYHPNAKGYAIVSRAVFEGLEGQGFFEPNDNLFFNILR